MEATTARENIYWSQFNQDPNPWIALGKEIEKQFKEREDRIAKSWKDVDMEKERRDLVTWVGNRCWFLRIVGEKGFPDVQAFLKEKAKNVDPDESEQLRTRSLTKLFTKLREGKFVLEKEAKEASKQIKVLQNGLIIPFRSHSFKLFVKFLNEHPDLEKEMDGDLWIVVEPMKRNDIKPFDQFLGSIIKDPEKAVARVEGFRVEEKKTFKQFLRLYAQFLADFSPLHNLQNKLFEKMKQPKPKDIPLRLVNAFLKAAEADLLEQFPSPYKVIPQIAGTYTGSGIGGISKRLSAASLKQEMEPKFWKHISPIFEKDHQEIQNFVYHLQEHSETLVEAFQRNKPEVKKLFALWGEFLCGLGTLHHMNQLLVQSDPSMPLRSLPIPLELCNAFFVKLGKRPLRKFPALLSEAS